MHKHRLKVLTQQSAKGHPFFVWLGCRHCSYWVCANRERREVIRSGYSLFPYWNIEKLANSFEMGF